MTKTTEIKKQIRDQLKGVLKSVRVVKSRNSNIFVQATVEDEKSGSSFWTIVSVIRNAGFVPCSFSEQEAKYGQPKTALISVNR